jgi:HAD superfamily hydrolase (TIGR01509 family)
MKFTALQLHIAVCCPNIKESIMAELTAPAPFPGLIIFDCDGVLVDSEPLAMRVLLEGVAEAGVDIPEALAYERFLGRSLAMVIQTLRDDFAVDLDAGHLDRMRDRLYARFREQLHPMPGIAEALHAIAAPVCVASSSQMERIRLSLELTGLAPAFADRIFSATMVAHGKPAPDLFLLTARHMQVAPAQCIVIEDSAAGIEAAKRAGMLAFAFTGGGHAKSAAHRERIVAMQADAVFDEMAHLPELIRRAGEKREGGE